MSLPYALSLTDYITAIGALKDIGRIPVCMAGGGHGAFSLSVGCIMLKMSRYTPVRSSALDNLLHLSQRRRSNITNLTKLGTGANTVAAFGTRRRSMDSSMRSRSSMFQLLRKQIITSDGAACMLRWRESEPGMVGRKSRNSKN